jgi:DNA-binding HxlR family transcriptional regulator
MKKQVKRRSSCPISSALDIIGDKWSLLIIRDIAFSGKTTYNEFLKAGEGIATNILADRLAMLEMTGILFKKEHPDKKAKIGYRLTAKGIDLIPILMEMILWSDKYLLINDQARNLAKVLHKQKKKLFRQMLKDLSRSL